MLAKQTTEYMEQMNKNIDDKLRIMDWITGDRVLDAGCGGGEFLLRLHQSGYDAYGLDFSLLSYKELYKKGLNKWFIHGDILNMKTYLEGMNIDTIVFSSVLHEVYSYNGFDIQKVIETLKNAYDALPVGGRIIIRDGIKTRDGHKKVLIRFKDVNDVLFLTEYCKRFEGRKVTFESVDKLTYKMELNDAMEFLYTYTWGWESFDREVQEQFGIATPNEYVNFVKFNLPKAKVLHKENYLQHGYVDYLTNKAWVLHEDKSLAKYPDSTFLMVIEKGE